MSYFFVRIRKFDMLYTTTDNRIKSMYNSMNDMMDGDKKQWESTIDTIHICTTNYSHFTIIIECASQLAVHISYQASQQSFFIFVMAFCPSDTACSHSSLGSNNFTDVWTSRIVRVVFLFILHSSPASNTILSSISRQKLFIIPMAC